MIVPAIGGLASELTAGLSGGLTKGASGAGAHTEGLAGAGQSGLGIEGTGIEGAGGGGSGSFGTELTEAISSLESTQRSADSAAQSLASGTTKDPEGAVVTVEDAQMAMDLAAQLRTKATEAVQNVFQTQV